MLLVLSLQQDYLFRRLQVGAQLAAQLYSSPFRLLLEYVYNLLDGAARIEVANLTLKLLIGNLAHIEQVLHEIHQQVGIRFYLLHVLSLRLGHRLVASKDDIDDHDD